MADRLSAAVSASIVRHARQDAPLECCGLLLGRDGVILEAIGAANVAADPDRRFTIDPASHIRIRRDARARGLDVLGFYHSHPRTPAMPSETDVAEASYPDAIHAIVSLLTDPPDVKLFRLSISGNLRVLELYR